MNHTLHATRLLAPAVLAVALTLPLSATARPPDGLGGDLEARIEQVDLDAETQASVDAILDQAREERRAIQRELRAAHEMMRELLQDADSDEASLVAQAERISALELEMHKRRIATHLELRTVLTAEQLESLVVAMRERPSRRGPRFRR